MKTEFIQCDCGAEVVGICGDDLDDASWPSHHVYLSIFTLGRPTYSWLERFRWAWQAIVKGNYFKDQVVLTPEQARQLALVLTERAEAVVSKQKD